MFVYLFLLVCLLFFNLIFKKKHINSTINLRIKQIDELNNELKLNEKNFYEFICKNIDISDFQFQFNNIIKQYNLCISNKTIYDRSFIIPNGEIFKYIFNQESCKMLLYEGIFCEINFQNIRIPLHIILLSN